MIENENNIIDLRNSINLRDVNFDETGSLISERGHIKEKRINNRPGHKLGIPYINCQYEEKFDKVISHNYGHSGMGWTIAFGTVMDAIQNYEKVAASKQISKSEQISIIGFGIIGLATAVKLLSLGYKNLILIGESDKALASHMAGAIFQIPVTFTSDNPFILDKLNKWMFHTYIEYNLVAKGKHPFINRGVDFTTLYADTITPGGGEYYLAKLNLFKPYKLVKVRYGDSRTPSEDIYYQVETFHVHTEEFLESLWETIKGFKIPVIKKRVNSFSEIGSKVIFNCSGLGSIDLNNDKSLYPITGHGLILQNQDQEKYNFCMNINQVGKLIGHEANGSLYFFPKKGNLFIGGTYLYNYDLNNEENNKKNIINVLKRARLFFNGIDPDDKLYPKF